MKIAVIGKGNIGGTLGSKWRAAGHDVVFGARDGSGKAPAGRRCAASATRWTAPRWCCWPSQARPCLASERAGRGAGGQGGDRRGEPVGAPEFDSRALLAAAAPSAKYVRAFNSLGWENFADPVPGANLFFAADPEARATAEELISAVGREPAFLGDATATETVDALLPLWFALVKQNGGDRKVALRIVR